MTFPIDRELSKLATKEGQLFSQAVELQLIVDSLARMAFKDSDTAIEKIEELESSASTIISKITGFRDSKICAHAENIMQHLRQELEEHHEQQPR
jgi:hypothetical protein